MNRDWKEMPAHGINQNIEEPRTICVIYLQETKKVPLYFSFTITHVNTSNQQSHLFLMTNIWGAIKNNRKILGLFNNLDDRICNITSHKRNQLILNFVAEIMIMNIIILNMSEMVLHYQVKFSDHLSTN